MKRIAFALLVFALACGLLCFLWANFRPSVVGVWKGTDEYGHEHYFEFHKDGSLAFWDRDRSHDGSFKERGPFRGSYKYQDRKTVVARTAGFPSDVIGILTFVAENELKQNDSGYAMRRNLVYRRVAGK